MDKINTLIVDDEKEARRGLVSLIEPHPEFTIAGVCKNGLEAIDQIKELKPDLVLLDIQMPEINGFEVLNSLRDFELPAVIFVTAYDQYAIKAFEMHALDYLLKPFSDERINSALENAKKHIYSEVLLKEIRNRQKKMIANLNINTPGSNALIEEPYEDPPYIRERLIIKSNGQIHFIPLDEIQWIEACDYYARIHMPDTQYLVRKSLKSLEELLPAPHFSRIHRSYIVNLNEITHIKPHAYGSFWVFLKNGKKLKLSRSFREKLSGTIPGL